jgi:hypothetical protein
LLDNVGQMGGNIGAGACLARFHPTCPVGTTNEAINARTPCRHVLVLAFPRFPRGYRLRSSLRQGGD